MTLAILIIIGVIVIAGVAFLYLSPEFGGSHSDEDIARYEKSEQYEEGKFKNGVPTSMDMGFGEMMSTLWEMVSGVPNSRPDSALSVLHQKPPLTTSADSTRLVWFGHSAFWLAIEGMNILIDPMFGDTPSPIQFMGSKRFSDGLPTDIAQLPKIDAIFFSHDHYDHLDYGSVKKLKDKTEMFFVPLGLGAHLREWGVDSARIKEMDWWEEEELKGIEIAFTPARHFSGRGLGDRFSTLWGSWVIKGKSKSIFFSGDSGYTPQFAEIGEKFGPFVFAMLECGQYNERWADIHMMPEQTVQASIDLRAKRFMPIHWAAFTLALHSWTDPVERAVAESEKLGAPIYVPRIGEMIELDKEDCEYDRWWEKDRNSIKNNIN